MGPVAVLAAILLLCLSPLMRGGNRQIALIVLEGVGLVFLLSTWIRLVSRQGSFLQTPERWQRKVALLVLVSSPAWLALIYLAPLPLSFWGGLPGRGIYERLMSDAGIPLATSLSLSLVPDATNASLLAGIPPVAGFIAGYAARLRQLKLLLGVVAAMAFLQVLLGLLQAAGGHASSLYFSVEFGGRPLGTFANTNHFANYIAMATAGYIWLGWNRVMSDGPESGPGGRFGERQTMAIWIAGGLLLVLGIVMTFSRGAALSGLPAVMLAVAVAYVAGGSSRNWLAALLLVVTVVVVAVALVGAGSLLSRFDPSRLSADASFRSLLASSTLAGAREFWPWGAGWGTYVSVYPRFQPIAVDGRADYAHQDYAQMLFEGGIFAVLIGVAFLWLVIPRITHLARNLLHKKILDQDELAAAVCGVGLLGFLIHSLVEFNMHIPANAILASLLAGAFLRPLRVRKKSK